MTHELFTLFLLILLQAVLGFDNLLYISLESKRAAPEKQSFVRALGIGIAIVLRILMLFTVKLLVDHFQEPFGNIVWPGVFECHITFQSMLNIAGGAFIIYTATKEIMHMMSLEETSHEEKTHKSTAAVIFWIVLMNLIFSFDSVLSAMALTDNHWTISIAIIISGLGMIWIADYVSAFLQKNRMYEVLGLFVLFIVGIMLLSEGGHEGHILFFNHEVERMSKGTFYLVIATLVITDVVQSRYQRKLVRMKKQTSDLSENANV